MSFRFIIIFIFKQKAFSLIHSHINYKPMKRLKLKLLVFSAVLAFVSPQVVCAESTFHGALPNIHGKSLTTPIGWGAAYGSVFAGVGGTIPSPYSSSADGAACVGVGIGNPVKHVGLEASVTSLDISNWTRYALNLKAHHYLGHGNSVAIGVENINIKDSVASQTDSGKSYYIVYSQGVQNPHVIDQETNKTRLHYSIGVGNGRFWDKSAADIAAGKGKHGTGVFGNVSYELFDAFNAIVDWNGVNLNAGVSKTFMLGRQSALGITFGVSDLTGYSGDRIRFIAGVGGGIMF
jgi:hypothetical protein